MKTTHFALAAMAACALLAAGTAGAKPMDKAEGDRIIAAIKAGEAQWNADVKARDAARFASHYADDATLMDPFMRPIHGRAAIEAAIREVMKDPNFTLVFEPATIEVDGGDLAYSRGRCIETETDPTTHAKLTNSCNYLTVYKRQPDGAWKAIEDIASPSAAPK